ncbi:hypothetical protein AB0G74_16325 [Streptomyces sp. NPDC020875]
MPDMKALRPGCSAFLMVHGQQPGSRTRSSDLLHEQRPCSARAEES